MAEHTDRSFYVTEGTLRQDAPSYVERRADVELFDGLLKGESCYVLTSRQMGKSSLMVRTAGKPDGNVLAGYGQELLVRLRRAAPFAETDAVSGKKPEIKQP